MNLSAQVSNIPSNPNIAWNNSFISVVNDQNRPLFAQATCDVNGFNGGTYITSSTPISGNWYAIQMLSDTTFAGLTANWNGNSVAITDVFSNGTVINGTFRGIAVNSGRVIAYNF